MFGDVTIAASSHKPGVYVPREAVLVTGKHEHLFVQTSPGRFEPRDVRTGATADGLVEILSGVKAGEKVVSSGQFLIDSESSIREAAAKMLEPKPQQKAAPEDMDMSDMQMGDHSAGVPNATAASRPKGGGQDATNHMDMGGMSMEDMSMDAASPKQPGKGHE